MRERLEFSLLSERATDCQLRQAVAGAARNGNITGELYVQNRVFWRTPADFVRTISPKPGGFQRAQKKR
jgi:hypothetical protein